MQKKGVVKLSNYIKKLEESIYYFDNFVKPILDQFWCYNLYRIEDIHSKLTEILDIYAGIDMFGFHKKENIIRTIGLRNQIVKTNYRTFTIRKNTDNGSENTEFKKRLKSFKTDSLYPYFTIQSYISKDKNKLLGFGIARTKDIFDLIYNGLCEEKTGSEKQIFKIVNYDDLDMLEYNNNIFKKNRRLINDKTRKN